MQKLFAFALINLFFLTYSLHGMLNEKSKKEIKQQLRQMNGDGNIKFLTEQSSRILDNAEDENEILFIQNILKEKKNKKLISSALQKGNTGQITQLFTSLLQARGKEQIKQQQEKIKRQQEKDKINKRFIETCEKGEMQTFIDLLINGADINATDKYKNNVLHIACKKKNFEMVTFIMKISDISPHSRNVQCTTPIHFAAKSNNLKLITFMLNKADTTKIGNNSITKSHFNTFDDTEFDYACYSGNMEVVTLLYKYYKHVSDQSLEAAKSGKNEKIIKFVTEKLKGKK